MSFPLSVSLQFAFTESCTDSNPPVWTSTIANTSSARDRTGLHSWSIGGSGLSCHSARIMPISTRPTDFYSRPTATGCKTTIARPCIPGSEPFPHRVAISPTQQQLTFLLCSIEDVVKSGKAHGATREDIYGCLYFHVSDQLRAFAARLARLNIAFKVFNRDSVALAGALARNALAPRGVPQSMRFDRIEASNVVDASYLGLAPVLEAWGRFLKRTRDATFLAYFMNWPGDQAGARPDETHGDIEALMDKCIELGRASHVL